MSHEIRWPEFVDVYGLVLLEEGVTGWPEVHRAGQFIAGDAPKRLIPAGAIPPGARICDYCFPDGLVVDRGAATVIAWLQLEADPAW